MTEQPSQPKQSPLNLTYTVEDFISANETPIIPFKNDAYQLIDSVDKLITAVQNIMKFPKVGIDTEQSFQETYQPFLCLIQISAGDTDYIIDLLAINDKENIHKQLSKVFLDENIIKVFFAGQQDLLWMQRDYNLKLVNYFDIQIAAQFINPEADNSLVALIDKYCGYKIDKQTKKTLQVSEWSHRPLKPEQLNYSALDSHYLVRLRFQLLLEIITKHGFNHTVQHLNAMQKATTKKESQHTFDFKSYLQLYPKVLKKLRNQEEKDLKKLDDSQPQQKQKTLDKRNTWEEDVLNAVIFARLAEIREDFCQRNDFYVNSVASDNQLLMIGQVRQKIFNNQEETNPMDIILDVVKTKQQSKIHEDEHKIVEQFIQSCQQILQSTRRGNLFIQECVNSLKDAISISKIQATNEFRIKMNFQQHSQSSQTSTTNDQQKQGQQSSFELAARQEKKQKAYEERFSMKKIAYENCAILSPSGEQLCNCNEKKVAWYLSKNLATRVSSNPTVIKLNFQPSGKGNFDMHNQAIFETNYLYVTHRDNLCVVCGATENFSKFYVVPALYRRHFPELLKSHRSQDILLMCMSCHQQASNHSDRLIKEISMKYSVDRVKFDEVSNTREIIRKLIRSARSYSKAQDGIPEQFKEKFQSQLQDNFKTFMELSNLEIPEELKVLPKDDKTGEIIINAEFLRVINDLNEQTLLGRAKWSQDYKNQHGKIIVEKLGTFEEITKFVIMWRKHFLETMAPAHLPKDWKEQLRIVDKEYMKETRQKENQSDIRETNDAKE